MSTGMPSMAALLGMIALAGFENRDRLSELLKGASSNTGPSSSAGASPMGGVLGSIGGLLVGAGAGGLLSGGIGQLVDTFKQNGLERLRSPG